jgi:N-carbamoyl-L-amino-acid hydrolase
MNRLLLLAALLAVPALSAGETLLNANADRIEQRILTLGTHGANAEGGVSRVAFSQADLDGRDYLRGLMEQAGLTVRIDTAGNMIGRREGSESLPPIAIGSHSDSVPGGGNYDGQVGVIGAIEIAQLLHENKRVLRHPLEVLIFSDEEGGLTGSRAMAGKLTEDALAVVSNSGLTVAQGIRKLGGDPEQLAKAHRRPGEIAAFVELHIEQGAILHDADIDIGVVTGIVGIEWWDITITGMANHAGTTPMNKRRAARDN